LKTGDIGRFDEDGYLMITDRKKDLIKTSGGKYIAPQMLENKIRISPLVSQVIVVGNERKFPAALIVPNFEALRSYAQSKVINCYDHRELVTHPAIIELYEHKVDELTAGVSQYEKIKKVALLPADFTIDGGELTPTMKVRRRVIENEYQDVIDQLYE
jgi:long-chain acyl-CoA synthetase